MIDLVTSRSYFITAEQNRKQRILAQVRALLDDHPALAGRPEIELPYVSFAWRVTR